MSTHDISGVAPHARDRAATVRARAVASLGPATMLCGTVWAVLQPERVTLLHPRGQGFWWLFVEPPLFVVVAGLLFHLFVARQLVADLDADQVHEPPAEHVHWLFASGILVLGLCLLAEAVVGEEVWRRRAWRSYLWPSFAFGMGVFMWPVMTFFTNSMIHMIAHGTWAQAMMLAGASELGLARGKLRSAWWRLCTPLAVVVSGLAFLLHEQNPWFFQRSAFLHHLMGWTLVVGALFPLARVMRPRSAVAHAGFALVFVCLSVMLFADRDLAPVFGHLSPLAGEPHR